MHAFFLLSCYAEFSIPGKEVDAEGGGVNVLDTSGVCWGVGGRGGGVAVQNTLLRTCQLKLPTSFNYSFFLISFSTKIFKWPFIKAFKKFLNFSVVTDRLVNPLIFFPAYPIFLACVGKNSGETKKCEKEQSDKNEKKRGKSKSFSIFWTVRVKIPASK